MKTIINTVLLLMKLIRTAVFGFVAWIILSTLVLINVVRMCFVALKLVFQAARKQSSSDIEGEARNITNIPVLK
jgi:hypothetical protein